MPGEIGALVFDVFHTQQPTSFSTAGEGSIELEEGLNSSHGEGTSITKKQQPFLELGGAVLIENNLGGFAPSGNGAGAMYFQGATLVLDADLKVSNLTEYVPWKLDVNGKLGKSSDLAQISLRCGQTVELLFEFLNSSSGKEVTFPKINFTIADLDHGENGRCKESIEIDQDAAYSLSDDSTITVSEGFSDDGFRRFAAGEKGTGEDNPLSLTSMSESERRKSVNFQFTNTNKFSIVVSTNSGVIGDSDDPDVIGYAGRRIVFGGTLA